MKDFFHQYVSFRESQMCLVFFHQHELSFHQDATCQPKLSPCRVPKIRGPFLWSRIRNLPSSWCVHNFTPNFTRSFFKARVSRALLVYHSFLPMSHICHSPKLQGIACSSLKISFCWEKVLEKQRYAPISMEKWKPESWKLAETALRASSNLLPCFHVWFWGTFQTVTITPSISTVSVLFDGEAFGIDLNRTNGGTSDLTAGSPENGPLEKEPFWKLSSLWGVRTWNTDCSNPS